ncbi:MAG: hypothetical protein C0506_00790 [Anaerolinea sp.]|nr:hypothetical protein [Anaerolinea sp.]
MLLAAFAGFALAACENERNQSQPGDRLEQHACTQDDVGAGFNLQTSGDFSPANLADLGYNAPARLTRFRAAGMTRGHFVYWKEIAGKPPFDPPLDIVCQVMEFQSDAQARTFVENASLHDITSNLIGWLPGSYEATPVEAPGASGSNRTFTLSGDGEAGPVTVAGVVMADGRYVRIVSLGGPGTAPNSIRAEAVQQRIAARAR